ncbi:hypothetical protein MC885_012377 [Smutsia gigantea]|nr:hypothetical protein MC885_012377 [Smutsia gigantea]
MKISAAAVFLIFATVLGAQGQAIRESLVAKRPFEPSIHTEGFHRPTDCCFSYTTRNIRCVFMQDYYVTSSECSMLAVIFFTKRRQRVCANPRDERKPLPGQLSSCSGSSNRRMKFSVAATSFLLLLLLLPHLTVALLSRMHLSPRGPYHPANCCFTYVTQAIPRHRIIDYYKTSSQCPKPGVIFITVKGASRCANPSDNWVQDYIKDLEEKGVAQK